MTFHQKIPFISFEKFIIFLSFFFPQIPKRFLRPTVRTSVSANGTYPSYDALRNGKEEEKKKKGCVSFQKVYYSFDTWPLCFTSRNANGKISYIGRCREKRKKRNERKSASTSPSRIPRLQHGSRFTGNQVPPPPRVRRGASVSPRFVILGQIIAPKTHTGMCETP